MGSTLTNGIYLPAEGERNCYTGLAANWTALDSLIGGYNVHIGNATIHVTAEDKAAWNGKADASALTAHTGDTTIHVTAADKEAWNGKADASALTAHTGDTTIHVTAEDKSKWDAVTTKANDADVMHLTGDENSTGKKVFGDMATFDGSYLGDEASSNARTNLVLESNRDTHGQSGIYIKKFRQDKPQGGLTGNDVVYMTLDVLENSVRTNNALRFNFKDFVNDVPTSIAFYPTGINNSLGGSTSASNKWTKINGLNPGSLSLPDLDNGIDISSYLDTTQSSQNYYTPPVNGWISIKGRSNSTSGIVIIQNGMAQMGYSLIDFGSSDRVTLCALPVKGGVQVEIWLKSVTTLDSAKFFPCLGNV